MNLSSLAVIFPTINNAGSIETHLLMASRFLQKGIVSAKANKAEIEDFIEQLKPLTCPDYNLIRLGPNSDGCYLVPDDLDGISACFSPGVNTVADFELDCAKKGMDVFLADLSVDSPPVNHERFHFTKKFIGSRIQLTSARS